MQGVLVIGSEQTEVGKSALAANIAANAARAGVRVCLYDTDAARTILSWSERRNRLGSGVPKIDVIAAASSVVHEDPGAMRKELEHLKVQYELIVVDVASTLSIGTARAFSAADRVLIPVVCGTLRHTEHTIQEAISVNRSIPIFLIYNLTRPSDVSDDPSSLVKEYGVRLLNTKISYRASWRSTFDIGLGVCEAANRDRDERAITELERASDELSCTSK